jgi:hypothetical protein
VPQREGAEYAQGELDAGLTLLIPDDDGGDERDKGRGWLAKRLGGRLLLFKFRTFPFPVPPCAPGIRGAHSEAVPKRLSLP